MAAINDAGDAHRRKAAVNSPGDYRWHDSTHTVLLLQSLVRM